MVEYLGKDSDGWEYETYDDSDPELDGCEYEYSFAVGDELELKIPSRRVVISTNIAETSLTIDGITTVVDSGLARESVFDPQTGMARLQTRRISNASSVQRMGRAGRQGPGHCYRLWSEQQQQQLAAHSSAEILQADLAPLVLQMLAWGIDDPAELDWMDPPPRGPFQQALQLLVEFGAVNDSHQLTAHGQKMAIMPVHPRLAHMLLVGAEHGLAEQACMLAAVLSERNPLSRDSADLQHRMAVVEGVDSCPGALKTWRQRVRQQAQKFLKIVGKSSGQAQFDHYQSLGLLVAAAYPDRIARRRDSTAKQDCAYQLSNGRTALLPAQDSLVNSEWLAVAELGGRSGFAEDIIYAAVSLDPALFDSALKQNLQCSDYVQWDNSSEAFIAEQRTVVGAIIINRQKLQQIPAEAKRTALLELVRKRGMQLLPWNGQLRNWQARVLLLREHLGEPWPDISDNALLANLEQWLGPYLDPVNRLSHFRQLDLGAILQNLLPWPLPQQLGELAPLHLQVPSGSNVQVDYSQSPPVLAVKLQEMFGCQQTPCIASGKVELMVHLLSPARRPLQITRDLAGFWHNSYEQVKKEMKGRYPKHPWPDNPLEALPTKYTKKRS